MGAQALFKAHLTDAVRRGDRHRVVFIGNIPINGSTVYDRIGIRNVAQIVRQAGRAEMHRIVQLAILGGHGNLGCSRQGGGRRDLSCNISAARNGDLWNLHLPFRDRDIIIKPGRIIFRK